MITFYIAVNYRRYGCNELMNLAFLRQQDAQDCVDEGYADSVLEVQSEEIGWMKQAADAACQFREWSDMGSLECSTLFHNIENYEQEIFYR